MQLPCVVRGEKWKKQKHQIDGQTGEQAEGLWDGEQHEKCGHWEGLGSCRRWGAWEHPQKSSKNREICCKEEDNVFLMSTTRN